MSLGIALLIFVQSTFAEYRVFRLSISNGGKEREVISILDQYQYPEYFPLNAGETIEYLDSWMCWGRQGIDVRPCPKPSNPQPSSGIKGPFDGNT